MCYNFYVKSFFKCVTKTKYSIILSTQAAVSCIPHELKSCSQAILITSHKEGKVNSRVIRREVNWLIGELWREIGEVTIRLKTRLVRGGHLLLLKLRTNKMQG
jgi:hypothetical protein